MASSNSRGLLAVATGNKSELACGYSTIYGDAVGGYAPIKDLLKTRVWEISRWRNKAAAAGVGIGGLKIVGNEDGNTGIPLKDGVMIPVSSIEKAPSAELRPGQKDSDSLPEYALLDKVLAAYIEHAHGRADLLADGFDQVTVDTVMRLVDRAEWKRRQYPLGPKVTALAFGRDRRLPVTTHSGNKHILLPPAGASNTVEEVPMTDDNKKQWYFNTVKKQAELGMVSPIEQRMGPYKTKEDAEHAWDIVVDRNARWEEENRRWKDYGVKPAQARPED